MTETDTEEGRERRRTRKQSTIVEDTVITNRDMKTDREGERCSGRVSPV